MDLFKPLKDAVSEALEEVFKISGGDWPSSYGMAEYALSVPIAKKLVFQMRCNGDENACASFDELYSRIWCWKHHLSKKYVSKTNPFHNSRQRADIALWSNRNERFGCIEVKRKFEPGSARNDLDRLCQAAKHFGASFQAFFVVFSSSNTPADDQAKQIAELTNGRDGYEITYHPVSVPTREEPPRLPNAVKNPHKHAVAFVFQVKKV